MTKPGKIIQIAVASSQNQDQQTDLVYFLDSQGNVWQKYWAQGKCYMVKCTFEFRDDIDLSKESQ